jgi:hypothetical protein
MPKSVEGLQTFLEEIRIKQISIIKETTHDQNDIIEWKYNFRYCLINAINKIRLILKSTDENIIQ